MTFWDYLIIPPLSTPAHAWPLLGSAENIAVTETAPALPYEAHSLMGRGRTDPFPYSDNQSGQGWDWNCLRNSDCPEWGT